MEKKETITGIIYKYTSKTTKKSYIGKTHSNSLKRRQYRHKTDKHDCHFYRARDKYGFEDFEFSIIEDNIPLIGTTRKEKDKFLNEREKYWIKYYDSFKNGYNSTIGGDGGNTYSGKTEEELLEIKKKLSLSSMGSKNAMSKEVKITNILTKEIKIFESLTEAGRFFSVSRSSIRRYILSSKIINDWQF